MKYEPADAELWFRKGIIHRHRGESGAAEACWRRILTLERPEQFRSVDLDIHGHLTLRNLAALAEERGDRAGAGKLWTAELAECSDDREAKAKLRSSEEGGNGENGGRKRGLFQSQVTGPRGLG